MVSVCVAALAFVGLTGLSHVLAQESTTTTTPVATSTTAADPVPTAPTTTTKTTPTTQRTTTTVKGVTTTVASGGRPVPPPASGPTQTLVPDLLGTPVGVETTTTLVPFSPFTSSSTPTTFVADTESASAIASHDTAPSAPTLILAAVAWLASFGGVLVYAEDRRAMRWKHLAR